MQIDNNAMMLRSIALEKEGKIEEGHRIRDEFVALMQQDKGYCPCTEKCIYHGKCKECVAIHRGHQDHFPVCLQPMGEEFKGES